MSVLTFTIIGVLALAMVGFYVLYKLFHEFDHLFLWVTYGFVAFIIGFAVYLSFTAEDPSSSISSGTPAPRTAGVMVDTSNLLQE